MLATHLPLVLEVKSEWSYTTTLLYAFMLLTGGTSPLAESRSAVEYLQ
jgi:hypothetical protein